MAIKPILFNTEMTQAILDGRKTQTRRIAKALCFTEKRSDGLPPSEFCFFISPKTGFVYWKDIEKMVTSDGKLVKVPYFPGDILWVRETWNYIEESDDDGFYVYAADRRAPAKRSDWKWHPSIHMPKEAARIFLRVKDVRVQHLLDMGYDDLASEGLYSWERFISLWDSTINPADEAKYGWNANPWVWAIEFEHCDKPEGWCE